MLQASVNFYKNKKVLQMNDFVSFKKTSFSEVSFNGNSSFSFALGNLKNKRWILWIQCHFIFSLHFVIGLAYQGKDIVFRFIIEYSRSLRDFSP